MNKQQQESSILAVLAAILLAACGGGGSGKTTEQAIAEDDAKIASAAPDCPVGYKSLTLDKSSVAGATFTMTAGNATLSFQTLDTTPSLKICFGVSANPIVDGGLYMLSDTYEIKTYPLDLYNADISNLSGDRNLIVDFNLDNVPAGVNFFELPNKVKVFNDAEGTLAATVQTSSSFSSTNNSGRLVVNPNKGGRYVVAYKP